MENIYCEMNRTRMLSFKIVIASFTIIVLSIWDWAREFVFGISVWWFVIIFAISLLSSGCCQKNSLSSVSRSPKTVKKTVKKKKR